MNKVIGNTTTTPLNPKKAGGGGGETNSFIAFYGETTFEDISNAVNDGKSVMLIDKADTRKRGLNEPGIYDSNYNFYRSVDDYNFASNTMPPSSLGAKLPNGEEFVIVVPEGVTSIGNYSLFGYNGDFKIIVLPESLRSIGNSALMSNTMETLIIPNSVTSIESNALSSNSNLKTIYYSGSATGFPWGATNATLLPNDGAEYDFGIIEGHHRNAYMCNATDDVFNFYDVIGAELHIYTCSKENKWSHSSTELITSEGFAEISDAMQNMVHKTDYADYLNYGVIKIDGPTGSKFFGISNGVLTARQTSKQYIAERYNYGIFTVDLIDYAVKQALSNCKLTGTDAWTDEEKASALALLGGVAQSLLSKSATNDTVVVRDGDGRIYTQTPKFDSHAATKEYVDELISGLQAQIDALNG